MDFYLRAFALHEQLHEREFYQPKVGLGNTSKNRYISILYLKFLMILNIFAFATDSRLLRKILFKVSSLFSFDLIILSQLFMSTIYSYYTFKLSF